MKISANDIRVGTVLEHNSKLWVVTKNQHVQPGKGGAFMQVEMKELKDGIQTIRYQLSTLQTTNGQSPFVTIYLEIIEGDEYEEEQALICEEMIRQRLEGMKNYKGQEIGEAFPKLVYVLDEHNCLNGGEYDYLTKLAVK